MLFNMAGNKKCHQHLAHKQIIYFITFIFQTQFHVKYSTWAEQTALKKTIKNVLHIFARLIHHSAVGNEILENNVVPIFSRVEQNLCNDNAYAKDLIYINKKLNNSVGSPFSPIVESKRQRSTASCNDGNNNNNNCSEFERSKSNEFTQNDNNQLSLSNMTGSSLLESYV